MRRVSLLAHLDILAEHWAVLWVNAVLDNLVSALDRTLTTQVSNTMLGDDNLHRVLAMVVVAYHRYESRDSTTLSGRWSGIDRDIRIAGEISQHFLTFRTAPQVRLKLLKLFQPNAKLV